MSDTFKCHACAGTGLASQATAAKQQARIDAERTSAATDERERIANQIAVDLKAIREYAGARSGELIAHLLRSTSF